MKLRTLIALGIFAAGAATAEANITTTSLRIQGAGLRVITETVTTSLDLPTTVQTEFGGKQNDEAVSLEGVMAVGDLTGPGIDTPIQLTTAPGHRFQIPGLSRQGIYYLQNVRLMKGAEFLQYASPATSVITVADLLQTKVTVRQLSPAELRARGITVDPRNYDVYEYSFTFIIDGREVVIPFPVIIDPRTHEVQPVRGESPYSLPPQGLIEPPRWSPPQIIAMDFGEEGELPEPGKDPVERAVKGARTSIPAAIVIPNSLAVLHQFFAVAVMVTNGAPAGSAARLEDIKATIKIPTALRTVKTVPQVSFGQPVPIVEPTTGVTFLVAQARGEAEWTLEGLESGTHRIDFDLRAVLRQEGQVDVPMRATPSAAIVVHDPRFNINFSHPDTVRKGIEYSTYSFITNMSATDQTIVVTSGVESCDENPNANVCRLNGETTDSLTIPAGDMRLIEYRLRSGVTGHVFATAGTLSSTDNLSASVRLHMGVSETGIPLSPATLVMPHYAQYVNQDVVSANLMLFGLGYSLATAPLNQMTAKFPRVIRTDIFQRAVDVARAGQRIFITDSNPEAKRDSIAHLALDLLGNGGYELREWDQLRRQEKSGRVAGASVMRELEATGLADGATTTRFFDAVAAATAHRQGFVAALAHGAAAGERPYAVSLAGHGSGRRSDIPNEASSGWVRDLAFSDISRFNGAGENGELGLVGRWTEDVDVEVTPAADGAFQLEILYPDTIDGSLKRAHFDLTGTANETLTIQLTRGATSLNATMANGGIAGVGTISTVSAAPLRIMGGRQDLHLDEDGHKVSVLFNRPVKVQQGVDLRTKFTGEIDFNRDGVTYQAPRPISAAALQEDGRTVNTTFAHTLSQNAAYTIAVATLVDPLNDQPAPFPDKVTPKIDNDAPAGVIYGKVIKGDNTPIAGADVQIAQYLPNDPNVDPQGTPQYDVSRTDGSFLFEFVRRQIDAGWTGAYRLEGLSSIHGKTTLEGSVRLPGKVHFANLQFLGRGAAQGYVRYNDGTIAAGATVTIGSTMFSQFRTAVTNAQGYYRIEDLPVGPLTFSAKDEPGNVTFAANEIATPGQLVTQDLSIFRQPFPGVGKVFGVVRRSDTNEPMAGIHVGVYSQGYGLTDGFTDSNGRFEFDKVPAGFVSVLAEDWTIARQSVAVDLDLKANEIKEANLLFLIAPEMKFTTLTGEVFRENPPQPGVTERVPGALVKIAGYRVVTADAEGKFTYDNLPLVFSGKGITAYDPATQRVNSAAVPTLTEAGPNNVAILINAFSRGTGTIRVRLLNAGGSPVAGYRVIVPGFPPDELRPAPGQVGVYELPNVAVGAEYEIMAVPSGVRPADGVADLRPYGDQMTGGKAKVEFNGHIAALTLRLPGEGTVRVKVRSQFDLIAPVKLTYPVWYEGEQSTVPQLLEESTEKNLEADWAVFTRIPALTNYSVSSAHVQYGYAGATSQLAYDGDFNEHTLQLNTLATVRGTVYAIDGVTPVAGASVTINNGRSDPGPQTTGPDGRFEFADQPSSTHVTVTAQVTQSGIYRIGFSSARTPDNGGVVENMAVVLRKRGLVDGQVVYKDYKRFDADNVANNIADDTPNDYSDNAPVPLAKFYLRELDFPNRNFGRSVEPLVADVNGQFVINNVFVGALRATGWDPGNEELRGDWTGRIDEEGAEAAPKAYIPVTGGGGGVGAAKITVVDPNQSYAEVQNAEVSLYAGGGKAFDFASTDATGSVEFTELPIGTYFVSAYSKSLGKTSKTESIAVPKDGVGTVRLELEFSGEVDGTLTDPENGNAPVPGSHIRLTASNYQTQASTDVAGFFVFKGVREGAFALDAKDTLTNRRAHADRTLSVLDPHRTVNLELEPTETLHFAAYLPDDFGNKSNVLAAPVRMEVIQRCWTGLDHVRHCDYERQLQGNPLQFPGVLENSGYGINIWQPGDTAPTINLGGSFPKGKSTDPFTYVYPAYGEVRVTVTQGGAPANGAKVTVSGGSPGVTVYTDGSGQAVVRNFRLGDVYIQASSIDNKFTGATSTTIARQSVPATASIALGTYAGVTGYVEAELGGPSIGTRVVANYAGHTAEIRTDSTGRYTFLGIPTTASDTTTVSLVFIGPDDTTVGGSTSKGVKAGDGVVEAPSVKLDATAPQLESIVPADGATSVSPDSTITVTFSEPLSGGTINTNNFQLVDADSGAIACALTSRNLEGGKFAITMTPPQPPSGFPLRSNTLYRVIVSGGVTDRTGHPLPGTRGFTFTTSDYAEPRVQKVLPVNPIPAATTFEFRFNEPIDPAPWQNGGNGVFHVYKLAAPGGPTAAIASELAARAFVDPATNMTLFIAPEDANPILPESFYRVVFSGVRDPQGNVLAAQTFHFESFDQVAPHVVFVAPAASEQLVSGSEYELRLELRNGSASGSIAADIRKVEYFTVVNNVEKPFATVTAAPFFTKVLGPEAPASGATFTVGAQAYDASGNQGPKTLITWTVKPNAAPSNVTVTPSTQAGYPSTVFTSIVTFQDEGSFASVHMTLSVPRNNGTTQNTNVTQSYTRLANGNWPEVKFTHTLPNDAKAGESATLSVTVSDVRGLTSPAATATVGIAPDTIQPNIISVTPPVNTTFFNKDKFVIEAIVSDAETGVQTVTFFVDGDPYATASQSAGLTAGTQKFRSVQIEAKAKADDALIPIVVTAKDFNGNIRSTTHDVLYKGVNDPDAPKVTWLCPVDRGALPALAGNFELKLRLNVVDQDVRTVKFLIGNDGTTVTGALVSGTEYGATYTFPQTPAPGPLTITAVVEDTVAAHTVELPITLDLVTADFTYTDPKAITAAEAASFNDKTIVLIGGGAVLAPQAPLHLANLLVLDGARVETLAATTTREFKVDITTTGITYVDCDSSVNASEKGYLGGWGSSTDGQNTGVFGRTVGNTTTGGADDGSSASHAGLGGSATGKSTNSVYGSIVAPAELGAGGGGSPAANRFGAPGGGAIALLGGNAESDVARIVIAGSVRADGGSSSAQRWGGGAGGSVRLSAKHVSFGPRSAVSANGGDDTGSGTGSWGAGGGRVAIIATAKLDHAAASIEARGGRAVNSTNAPSVLNGGAGTVYIRKPGQERGELIASSYLSEFPTTLHQSRPTPLGRIGKGTSTAVAANTLTDTSRTFDKWMVGEELIVGPGTTRSFTVIGISSDAKSLQTDAADGSLLDVATSQTVAYSGMLAFDKITAGKRALLVFDDHASAAGLVDDKSAMVIDPTAAVVLLDEQAVLTMTTSPAAGANIIRDTPLTATYTAATAAGVSSVTFNWSPESTPRVETFTDYPSPTPSRNLTFTVPPATPLGTATLAVEIKDRAGRTYTMPSRTYTVVDNAAPVISGFTVAPGNSIHAGRDVVGTVTATDDIAVKTIAFDAKLNGTSIKTQTFTPNVASATAVFTVAIAPEVAGGSTLTIDVTVSDGFAGRVPTADVQTVAILTDAGNPQVAVTSPVAGGSYKESSKIPVRATATDAEVAVKEVFAQIDGGTVVPLALVAGDWRADVTAPPVDGEQPTQRSLTVTAKDYAGNATVSNPIALTITPVIDANAPVLSWTCASTGAMFPAGTSAKLRVTAIAANAQNPVQTVEMFVDGAAASLAVTSLGSNQYEATLPIPADAPEGRTYSVRAVAASAGGATSDLLTSFTAIVADSAPIAASMTIEPANTTYDGKTVVVTGGTVTIRGPHTFDRLIVLGGTIVHASLEKLELTTTRGLYVACGAGIDPVGRGYNANTSYTGAGRSTDFNGGSHFGRGGVHSGELGLTYGSVYRPQEAGGGNGACCGLANAPGGGIVRITAASLAVDGLIRANGADADGATGAGGSVWITTGRITGAGVIAANGGTNTNCCNYGGGGGGAVALEYTDATSVLPVLQAVASTSSRLGGGGVVYVKGPGATYGDVKIDNRSVNGQVTELPSLGNGTAQPGTAGATLATGRGANVPAYFAGHWVEITSAGGTVKGTWRIAAVLPNSTTVTLAPNGSETIALVEGDKWQGVYLFDTLRTTGVKLISVDPIRAAAMDATGSNELQNATTAQSVTVRGTVSATSITSNDMTVETGGLLRQFGSSLMLNVQNLTVRGSIDVTGQGYSANTSYPNAGRSTDFNGGSHFGRGGVHSGELGLTFGSLYRPQEAGGGNGACCGLANAPGGGILRITAGTMVVDGLIRSNGANSDGATGAGGSVWITTGRITGTGTIAANGGTNTNCCNYGGGGGGAVALEYTDATSVLPVLQAVAATSSRLGGGGVVYVKGPGATYGDVTIDNRSVNGQVTELPSLGNGTAQSGTTGVTLATGRSANVPAYFAGHWVEITSAAGTLKGTWRIAMVPPNSTTVTLAPNGSETIALQVGDKWQGVYRFDTARITGVKLISADPIRAAVMDVSGSEIELQNATTAQSLTVRGTVSASSIMAADLTVETGALLRQFGSSLTLDVQNLTVRGSIDVTGQGYSANTSYPGAGRSTDFNGGSHFGVGGVHSGELGLTYGSFYRPQEAGGGNGACCGLANAPGGGILRITAGTMVVDGLIRSNGANSDGATGAGGSVWITTGRITGTGTIAANGGTNTNCCNYGGGGGGAVAVEYTDATSVMPVLQAVASTSSRLGGGGVVYVKGPGATYGDLTVDNRSVNGQVTELPSLGNGTAQPGTAGATLATGRSANVPAYFAGHWVEITSAGGTVKGTWRIATVLPNSTTVTLAPNGSETIALEEGDKWQGVYRLDTVRLTGAKLISADPIRSAVFDVSGSNVEIQKRTDAETLTIRGSVSANAINATNLTVETGAVLRQFGNALTLNAQNLIVRGSIDVSGQGYGPNTTYPGAARSTDFNGGAHIGRGGVHSGEWGSSFGSVYRPQEAGGGNGACCGLSSSPGGGVVRITAATLAVDGSIRANGPDADGSTGAGGSIWISAGKITGTGSITANSGRNTNCCNYGSGGGGALALEYTDASSVVPVLQAMSAPGSRQGGPGIFYVKGATSTYGDATIDNAGKNGQVTDLPSLGRGRAETGTGGVTVITDLAASIPAYFAGHWVDVFAPGGARKGTWRIASINGKNFTLAPNGGETVDVAAGDSWRGVYLFDKLTLRNATVRLLDDIRSTRDLDSSSSITINDPPTVNAGLLTLQSTGGGDTVIGTAGAVTDLHPPIVVTATNKRTAATFTATAAGDGSFRVTVAGEVGDTFTLRATDSYGLPATSTAVNVTGTIVNVNEVTQVTLQPATATGGTTVIGSVRMLYPVLRASAGLVTLGRSGSSVTIPATVAIPVGASSGAFQITTTSVATDTNVEITASANGSSKSATLTLLASGALASVTVAPASVEGGATANGTVTLAEVAPASGATVSLFSSDVSLATVPATVVIPAGSIDAPFSIATSKVGASATATITAVYGSTKSAELALTACAALGAVAPPSSAPLTTVWIDDALPANATATGDGVFTAAQAGSGTQSVSLTATGPAGWTVSGMSFSVLPADNLVLYALVNPCDPPREILAAWSDGVTTYRASWGEDLVDATLAHTRVSSMPAGGVWVRLEVLASRLFGNVSKSVKSLTVKTDGGELWLDRIGTATCSLTPNVAPPAAFPSFETVAVDDAAPAGVTIRNDTNNSAVWNWDTTQIASGSASHVEPVAPGFHQHYYFNDPNPVAVQPGDVLYTYVLIDPCNPPREIMLQWHDGSGWEHRAYWGEDLMGGTRYRVGPMPEAGKWVRLEVPAAVVGLNEQKIYGMAFTLYDGRTWFDRSGKLGRVNLALGKPASQLTDYTVDYPASGAVDGVVSPAPRSMSITAHGSERWWEVDLGESVPMIEAIEIRGRTDCCANQTSNLTVFVSDSAIDSNTTLTAARALSGVGIYRSPGTVGSTYTFDVGRRGRYVRIWRGGTDYLSLPEVLVWAPASSKPVNVAAGKRASVPADHMYQQYHPEHAVNGSASDSWNTSGGIYHSTGALDSYWQVDLGKSYPISNIDISSRTDCCPEQLTGYYVLASDQPFSESLAPNLTDSDVSVWWVGSFRPVADIPVNKTARYIRLQKPGSGAAIVFTEVRVWSQQPNTILLSVPARRE
ncbi:MAG TPA: Ig-like domain-containing protein [Thermoanaerobaculia bacterium]|nr:Ig-like domain-containing protein [Thermoanaerobaculia bacterium]